MIHTQDVIDIIKKRIKSAEDERTLAYTEDPNIAAEMDTIIWELNNILDAVDELVEEPYCTCCDFDCECSE